MAREISLGGATVPGDGILLHGREALRRRPQPRRTGSSCSGSARTSGLGRSCARSRIRPRRSDDHRRARLAALRRQRPFLDSALSGRPVLGDEAPRASGTAPSSSIRRATAGGTRSSIVSPAATRLRTSLDEIGGDSSSNEDHPVAVATEVAVRKAEARSDRKLDVLQDLLRLLPLLRTGLLDPPRRRRLRLRSDRRVPNRR